LYFSLWIKTTWKHFFIYIFFLIYIFRYLSIRNVSADENCWGNVWLVPGSTLLPHKLIETNILLCIFYFCHVYVLWSFTHVFVQVAKIIFCAWWTTDDLNSKKFVAFAKLKLIKDALLSGSRILQFFYNNYLNNFNFNNKSDKIKILRIWMTARHYQWRCVNASIPLMSLCKDATKSDVFQFLFFFKT
jgi:hypothetical protein